MKTLMLGAAVAAALVAHATPAPAQTAPPVAMTACDANAQVLGTIRLPQPVLADGKSLAPGTYTVRLTSERPSPAPGQSPGAECWVEFLKGGVVQGRDVATVIPGDQAAAVIKGPAPARDSARVDILKGGDYVRAWINHANAHYLVNLPVVQEGRP
jgi:hypothetical protein